MNSAKYHLRPVRISDAKTLYQWATSKDVRENAIHQEIFSYEHHLKWIGGKIQSAACKFFILEFDQKTIGQIRIDKIDQDWILDYSVDREWRGKGLGQKIIELFLKEIGSVNIVAQVLETNAASIRVFEKLGFRRVKNETIQNRNFVVFRKDSES